MALLRVILPEVPDRDYPITPEMISIFRKGPFFKADSQAERADSQAERKRIPNDQLPKGKREVPQGKRNDVPNTPDAPVSPPAVTPVAAPAVVYGSGAYVGNMGILSSSISGIWDPSGKGLVSVLPAPPQDEPSNADSSSLGDSLFGIDFESVPAEFEVAV
jgi:hypothetical protein